MKLLRKAWYPIPVTLMLGLFGCADHPTAPAPGLGVLEWREPVEEIVANQMIGPAGGVIELLGTGTEIHFPEGAVSESVLIEARVLEGSVVAFEFGVPGLPLAVPIEIRIDRERLARPWLEILGVYLEGGSTSDPVILEIFPVLYDGGTILFELAPGESRKLRGFAVASG